MHVSLFLGNCLRESGVGITLFGSVLTGPRMAHASSTELEHVELIDALTSCKKLPESHNSVQRASVLLCVLQRLQSMFWLEARSRLDRWRGQIIQPGLICVPSNKFLIGLGHHQGA